MLTEVEQVVQSWRNRYGHNRAAAMTVEAAAARAVAEFDVDTAFEAMNRLANYRAPDPAYLLDRCADIVRERAAAPARGRGGTRSKFDTRNSKPDAHAKAWRAAQERRIQAGEVTIASLIEQYETDDRPHLDALLPDQLEYAAELYERAGREVPEELRPWAQDTRRSA